MDTPRQTHTRYLADAPALLTIDETARLLHLSRRRINGLLAEGRLSGPKITPGSGRSGRRLILRESIERLIAAGLRG